MNTLILIYLFAWNRGDIFENQIVSKIRDHLSTSAEIKDKLSDSFE